MQPQEGHDPMYPAPSRHNTSHISTEPSPQCGRLRMRCWERSMRSGPIGKYGVAYFPRDRACFGQMQTTFNGVPNLDFGSNIEHVYICASCAA